MIRLNGTERFYISEDLVGLASQLSKDGTIPRMVDLLFLGFGYAVQNELLPVEVKKKHELVAVSNFQGDDMLLALEATAQWYAEKIGDTLPTESSELLNLICEIGVIGARELGKRWVSRRKSQIQIDIMSFTTSLN